MTQQLFSLMAPQQPKNDTTKIMQPSVITRMGIVSLLSASSKLVKWPISPNMIAPKIISNKPNTLELRNY